MINLSCGLTEQFLHSLLVKVIIWDLESIYKGLLGRLAYKNIRETLYFLNKKNSLWRIAFVSEIFLHDDFL